MPPTANRGSQQIGGKIPLAMPPLANEAELGRYWAAQPKPASRAEWIEGYVSALERVRPGLALEAAYAAAIASHATQGRIHPRLAAAADLILGPL